MVNQIKNVKCCAIFRHARLSGRKIGWRQESFASFKAFETTRTPAQILTHVGDLLDWVDR